MDSADSTPYQPQMYQTYICTSIPFVVLCTCVMNHPVLFGISLLIAGRTLSLIKPLGFGTRDSEHHPPILVHYLLPKHPLNLPHGHAIQYNLLISHIAMTSSHQSSSIMITPRELAPKRPLAQIPALTTTQHTLTPPRQSPSVM